MLSAPGTRIIGRKTSIGALVTVDEPGGKVASDGVLTRIPGHRTAPVLASRPVGGDKPDLTVEPAGGTARPTTRPIADISLPR